MADYKITDAKVNEASEIARLHIDAERQTYAGIIPYILDGVSEHDSRTCMWRAALSMEQAWSQVLIARHTSGLLIGFLSGSMLRDIPDARLNSIYVLKEYQNRSVGQQLFCRYVRNLHFRKVRNMFCVVPERNSRAREFFAWCGGVEVNYENVLDSTSKVKMVKVIWKEIDEVVKYVSLIEIRQTPDV